MPVLKTAFAMTWDHLLPSDDGAASSALSRGVSMDEFRAATKDPSYAYSVTRLQLKISISTTFIHHIHKIIQNHVSLIVWVLGMILVTPTVGII